MSIKTITITENAYESIKNLKNPGESFSQLFVRLSSKKLKIRDLCGAVKMNDKSADSFKKRTKEYREKTSKDIEERRKKCIF
ncbi:antitoxin VapB family protein [Candidatus Woesearchaeota archaeon]|nr:antitoxin VapB family protein [Candidatus Woesearchaeota archaeon]